MLQRSTFISGHIDVDYDFFIKHYKEDIDTAINNNEYFVIGDSKGIDFFALKYLLDNNYPKNKIFIYIFNKKNIDKYINFGVNLVFKKYKNVDERDANMTTNSDYDICYVRTKDEQKELYKNKFIPNRISGTEKKYIKKKNVLTYYNY